MNIFRVAALVSLLICILSPLALFAGYTWEIPVVMVVEIAIAIGLAKSDLEAVIQSKKKQ